jgi:hypothetical protein
MIRPRFRLSIKTLDESIVVAIVSSEPNCIVEKEFRLKASSKIVRAMALLKSCHGRLGIWADPSRYRRQNWTRDFSMAIAPLEMSHGDPAIVGRHLQSLIARQRPDGQIPILFLDGFGGTVHFVVTKTWKAIRQRRPSFMLKRWMQGGLEQLTPGTRDSELHFIIAVLEAMNRGWHIDGAYDAAVKAMDYVKRNLLNAEGLHVGCDWRDTMHIELGDKALLSNQALLYHAYDLMGMSGAANKLKARVDELYWSTFNLLDYPGPGGERFDPLGASLAVLHGLIDADRYADVMEGFRSVDSPHGVTIMCKHNPISADEARVIEETNGIVVWPFVVGFAVLAANKINQVSQTKRPRHFVKAQFDKLLALDGFREYYDPRTGLGYGADHQLWSATLTARAYYALCIGDE